MNESRYFDVYRVRLPPFASGAPKPVAELMAEHLCATDEADASDHRKRGKTILPREFWHAVEREPDPPKHSPTPWKQAVGDYLRDADGAPVNLFSEGNLALVAKCVSAHEGLVAACKRATAIGSCPDRDCGCLVCQCKAAVKALKKPDASPQR